MCFGAQSIEEKNNAENVFVLLQLPKRKVEHRKLFLASFITFTSL